MRFMYTFSISLSAQCSCLTLLISDRRSHWLRGGNSGLGLVRSVLHFCSFFGFSASLLQLKKKKKIQGYVKTQQNICIMIVCTVIRYSSTLETRIRSYLTGEQNQQTLLVNHMEPSKDFVPRRLPYMRRMDHCRGYRHITLRILKKETHPVWKRCTGQQHWCVAMAVFEGGRGEEGGGGGRGGRRNTIAPKILYLQGLW